ncbi:MAG: LysR family transcriptional regulator [Sediminimonas sp.]|uniref:LysR family transcriptional regulator n=1 Tax=Sediminimonas sp. TaxID=2823379 RepID=UPI002870AA68|nr:LysR family transcriptional regulator [Sediminimonas sp.]MDR9485939.1 LysR family transcriptional regulator [Sediminimonas sp.]
MNLERLDLNLLVAIDVLLRSRNVTVAAAQLNMTQSALSSALRRARQHFEDEILFYDGQQMTLTPFGRELEQIVPDMVLRLRSVARMRAQTDLSQMERRFSVIASDYVAIVYLADLCRELARQAPGISLEVVPFAPEAVEQFRRGKIDFLIAPAFALDAGSQTDLLFEDSFDCVFWRDRPLHDGTLSRETFLTSPHVVTNFFLDDGKSHLERWFDAQGIDIRVAAALPSFALLPYFISGTDNIATIHRRLVPHFSANPELHFATPPLPIPRLQEFLVTRDFLKHDTEAQLLRRFMCTVGEGMKSS